MTYLDVLSSDSSSSPVSSAGGGSSAGRTTGSCSSPGSRSMTVLSSVMRRPYPYIAALLAALLVAFNVTPAAAGIHRDSGPRGDTPPDPVLQGHAEQQWEDIGVYVRTLEWTAIAHYVDAITPDPAPPRKATASVQNDTGGDTGGRHYLCPQFASSDNPTGDFAVPCYIIDRESDGNYHVPNGQGSSAYGAYQILHMPPGTSPAEQDRIARGMDLCNWNPPNYCAGG